MKKKTMGQRIREARLTAAHGAGTDQGTWAYCCGISRQTLSGLERDAIKHPKAETLQGVAKALGVTVDYLLTGRSR